MIDHISIRVSDFESSKRFFEVSLAPLGYKLIFEHGISGAGFGRSGKPDFWIKQGQPSPSLHIAFASDDRAMVDAFHKAATAAGNPAASALMLPALDSCVRRNNEPSPGCCGGSINSAAI